MRTTQSAAITIGQVAKLAKVSVETVRFYEREGLLEAPIRSKSGYRQFSLDAIRRIQFIQRAKALGFSLKEVSELLTMRLAPDTTCGNIEQQAQTKLQEVEAKIQDLLHIKAVLLELTLTCSGGSRTLNECPILEALDFPPKEAFSL